MRRLATLLALGILALTLTVGVAVSQDTKKGKAKMNMLPFGWKALNLSAVQKRKVYDIQSQYRVKIDQLEDQIEKLRAQSRQEAIQVLTDEQKAMLVRDLTGERPKTPAKKVAPETKESK